MPNISGFIVRASGRFPGKQYIDQDGCYALGDLAEATGLSKEKLEQIYLKNGAAYEESLGVYFFDSREAALGTIKELDEVLAGSSGKSVYLSHEEIDYIRQALINAGSNVISVRNELKRRIFEKFNR
jgi:hypothetical protein